MPDPRADAATSPRHDEGPNDGPRDDAAGTADRSDDTEQGAQVSRVDMPAPGADPGALLPITTAPAGSADPAPLQAGDEVSLDVVSAWSVGALPQATISNANAGPRAPQPQQAISPHGLPTDGGEVAPAGGQMPIELPIDATGSGDPAPGTGRDLKPSSQMDDAAPTTQSASLDVTATGGTPTPPMPTAGNSAAGDARSAAVSAPVGTAGALSLATPPETAAPTANESSQASAPAAPAGSGEPPTAHAVATNPPATSAPPPKPKTAISAATDANGEDTTPAPQTVSIGKDDAASGNHDSVAGDGNVRLSLAHSSVSAAAMPTKTPAPSAPNLPIQEQVAAQVVRAAHDGVSRLHLALEPGSLGKLDISLEIHRDGRVSAMITADNPQTLEALRGESKALTQSLNNAGLKADQNSINFGFRASGEGASGNHAGSNGQGRSPAEPASLRDSGAVGIHDPLEVVPWPSTRPVAGAGRLDIHA